MAEAAYVYETSPRKRLREIEQPPLRALPGRRTSTQPAAKPAHRTLLKTAALTSVFCMIFCVVAGLACVSISNATVQSLIASEEITASIQEARAAGIALEVQHALATNPIRIQEAAAELGMMPASKTKVIEATYALHDPALAKLSKATAKDAADKKTKKTKKASADKNKKVSAANKSGSTAGDNKAGSDNDCDTSATDATSNKSTG